MKKRLVKLTSVLGMVAALAMTFASCDFGPKVVSDPVIDVAADGVTVTITTATEGADIMYSVDAAAEKKYDGAFKLTQNRKETSYKIEAYATKDGVNSGKATRTVKVPGSAKNVKVTFDVDGTTTEVVVLEGDAVDAPETTPVKEGYEFTGWFLADAEEAYDFETAVESDIILTAKFDVKKYTVTFDVDGKTTTQSVEYGKTAKAPEDPTKDGFYFGGWVDGEGNVFAFTTPIKDNVTLKATWSNDPVYTITLDLNYEGAEKATSVKATKEKGYKVSVTNPEREGFVIDKWTSDKEGTTVVDMKAAFSEDKTVYAQWKVATFTVTFNSDGGSALESVTVEYGKTITKPADPTKGIYVVDGWYIGDAKVNFETYVVKSNVELKVKWVLPWGTAPDVTGTVTMKAEGTNATMTNVYANGAVGAILETTNNGTDLALTIEGAKATYEKVQIVFDYEVLNWSDETVNPKFRLVSKDAEGNNVIATQYFDGAVAGGTIDKIVKLDADITNIVLGFNAYEWTGAEGDMIKVVVKQVSLIEPTPFDLGDETEGTFGENFTLNTSSSTASDKKTYTNGKVAALLDASGTNIKLTVNASAATYEKVVIDFDYAAVSGADDFFPKLYVKANDTAFADQYPWIDAKEGSKTLTLPFTKNLTEITFGFNAHQYTGAATDSFKIVIKSISYVEKIGEVTPIEVDLTAIDSYSAADGGLVWSGDYSTIGNYSPIFTFNIADLATITSGHNVVEVLVKLFDENGTEVTVGDWSNNLAGNAGGEANWNLGKAGHYTEVGADATTLSVLKKGATDGNWSKVVITKITFCHQ